MPAEDSLLAFDALIHGDLDGPGRGASVSLPSTDEDGQARSRLLLLLRMIEAAEEPVDLTGGDASEADVGEDPPLLGRFEVIEELGAGGFGFVVRARDRVLGREVALKLPRPERLLRPAMSRDRSARRGPRRGWTTPASSGSSTPASSGRWATSLPRNSATGRACGAG